MTLPLPDLLPGLVLPGIWTCMVVATFAIPDTASDAVCGGGAVDVSWSCSCSEMCRDTLAADAASAWSWDTGIVWNWLIGIDCSVWSCCVTVWSCDTGTACNCDSVGSCETGMLTVSPPAPDTAWSWGGTAARVPPDSLDWDMLSQRFGFNRHDTIGQGLYTNATVLDPRVGRWLG